jgi:hypothetical protein
MQTIPLQPVPNQVTKVVLGGQNCQIRINLRGVSLFADVNADGVDIVTTVIARDIAPLVYSELSGFIGNLFFVDTLGSADPEFTGLGTRWRLVYLTAAENEQFFA